MIALRFLLRMEGGQRWVSRKSIYNRVTPIRIAVASELFPRGGLITAPHRQAFLRVTCTVRPFAWLICWQRRVTDNRRDWRSMRRPGDCSDCRLSTFDAV